MLSDIHTNFNKFNEIADILLNKVNLNIKGEKYRICEIEFYYHGDGHKDEYTHKDKDQLTFKKFYFHKYKTGSYKSGTYKGMDITLGNNTTYFGILIRSICNIQTNEFIEGPCRTVNKILELFGVSDVSQFMINKNNILSIDDASNELFIELNNTLQKEDIYQGPRIGLSDKYPAFRNLDYRYAVKIKNIKKERSKFKKITV